MSVSQSDDIPGLYNKVSVAVSQSDDVTGLYNKVSVAVSQSDDVTGLYNKVSVAVSQRDDVIELAVSLVTFNTWQAGRAVSSTARSAGCLYTAPQVTVTPSGLSVSPLSQLMAVTMVGNPDPRQSFSF